MQSKVIVIISDVVFSWNIKNCPIFCFGLVFSHLVPENTTNNEVVDPQMLSRIIKC